MSNEKNNDNRRFLRCPYCSHRSPYTVPGLYHLVAQECDGCGSLFEVPEGAHCLFCAYGDAPCGNADD